MMTRRTLLSTLLSTVLSILATSLATTTGLLAGLTSGWWSRGAGNAHATPAGDTPTIEPLVLDDAEWKKRLTPAQYAVLRKAGTERPFSSPLNDEKRAGTFLCVACDLPLFSSQAKFDSGTGWPSFYDYLPGSLAFETDWKLVYPRTEYHCARCGGHQGHVFDDGPPPTGKRYCNNGVCLRFEVA